MAKSRKPKDLVREEKLTFTTTKKIKDGLRRAAAHNKKTMSTLVHQLAADWLAGRLEVKK
jgi:hypothetical protein